MDARKLEAARSLVSATQEDRRRRCDCLLASMLIADDGFLEYASLFRWCPNITSKECLDLQGRALKVLATKVELFLDGSKLGLWERLFCSSPTIRNIHENKRHERPGRILVKQFYKSIMEKEDKGMALEILRSAIAVAVRNGNYEFIDECLLACPGIICDKFDGSSFFHYAIQQRQEKVFNFIYQMSSYKRHLINQVNYDTQENILHVTAKLAPPHRLETIPGVALQMQRELQWFKEVEKFVEPSYKEALNIEKKTPRMVFTDEHKDLRIKSEQWIKATSASLAAVARIVTIVTLALAMFHMSYESKDDGKTVFLEDTSSVLFGMSSSLAIISSIFSAWVFVRIFTSSCFLEDDFLYALPRGVAIGLVFLLLSSAAILVAFAATPVGKNQLIAGLIVIVAHLSVWPQFHLLVELVHSTYGQSIFRKQNERRIH